MHGEIAIYQASENPNFQIEVRVEDETVWLNRHQIASLFNRDIKTFGKHIEYALQEELRSLSVVAIFAITETGAKGFNVKIYLPGKTNCVGYNIENECYNLLYNCLFLC
jgi:hypothetical protein